MKSNSINAVRETFGHSIISVSIAVLALTFIVQASIAQGANEPRSSVQKEKLVFKMQLSTAVSNGIRSVKVQIRRKDNKKTLPVGNLKSPFNIYLNEVTESNPANGNGWIGKIHTNAEGIGILEVPANINKLSSGLHEFTFIAKMELDPVYEDAEGEITVSDAKITLKYNGEDSIKTATATLSAWKDSGYVPVPDAEVKLSIKRTFNSLPFGEEGLATDENGEVSGELPLDLPGNPDRTITILARLEDDEAYGTVEAVINVPWAVLPRVNPVRGRTLWSSGDNAPIPLVVSSVTIVVIIWGTILYLVYLLFRIKKLGQTPSIQQQK